jgi:hypothetical protein
MMSTCSRKQLRLLSGGDSLFSQENNLRAHMGGFRRYLAFIFKEESFLA